MKGRAVSAGRGVAYVTGAKLYFMVAGAGIEIVLPRILGATLFGAYAYVVAFVSVVNNVLVTGTIQTISRFSSQDERRVPSVLRAGLRMNLAVGACVTGGYLLCAVALCALERDFAKLWLLWLAGGVPFCYALYAVFVGAANGLRQFHKQAALDVGFSTLRALFVVGGAILLQVKGAIGGFVLAAGLILVLASRVVGLPEATTRQETRPMVRFLGAVAAYQLFLNLSMHLDLFLLKRFALDAAAGIVAIADTQVGYYRAVQNLARLPYQALLAVTFIVFPLISRATFDDDREAARGYVRDTLRYSLLGALALALPFIALPAPVLALFYPRAYTVGTLALPLLTLGTVGFVLFTIAGAVLNGAGKTRPAIGLGLLLLAVEAGGCVLFIRGSALGSPILSAAATATAIAYGAGCVLSGIVLWRQFGAFIRPLTLSRTAVAAGGAIVAGRFLPRRGKLVTLAECAAVATVFLLLLVVSGELRRSEIARLRRRLPGRPSASRS